MTLMAGPIDPRVNPTKVNKLAQSKPMEWFEKNLIATVPMRYAGAFRRVYPGFVQLAAFMSMNIERHIKAHRDLYDNLVKGEIEKAQTTKKFYDEYFAVLDLTAEFYLETVRLVFQEHRAAARPDRVSRRARSIRARSAAPCCSPSRASATTSARSARPSAAHDLCTSLRPYMKRHHMQPGVGHYGVFSGKSWENQIFPILKNVILSSD